jgi:hypothetical protein
LDTGKKTLLTDRKKEKQKEDSVIERGETVGEWNAEIESCWWQHYPPSKKKVNCPVFRES